MPHLMPMSWLLCFICLLLSWFFIFLLHWTFIACKKEIFFTSAKGLKQSKFSFLW